MPPTPSVRNQANSAHNIDGPATGIVLQAGVFTGAAHGGCPGITRVRASVYADRAGTLALEESNDGTTWRAVPASVLSASGATVASTLYRSGDVLIHRALYRFKWTEGNAGATTICEIDAIGITT